MPHDLNPGTRVRVVKAPDCWPPSIRALKEIGTILGQGATGELYRVEFPSGQFWLGPDNVEETTMLHPDAPLRDDEALRAEMLRLVGLPNSGDLRAALAEYASSLLPPLKPRVRVEVVAEDREARSVTFNVTVEWGP